MLSLWESSLLASVAQTSPGCLSVVVINVPASECAGGKVSGWGYPLPGRTWSQLDQGSSSQWGSLPTEVQSRLHLYLFFGRKVHSSQWEEKRQQSRISYPLSFCLEVESPVKRLGQRFASMRYMLLWELSGPHQ